MAEKEPIIFIEHILESINDIKSFTKGISKKELSKNKEKLNAIVRSIEIIGEAAKNLSSSFKDKYPKILWKEIIGTRDIIIHHYFGIDRDIILGIIKKDMPNLEKQIKKIKEELMPKS